MWGNELLSPESVHLQSVCIVFELRRVRLRSVCTVCNALALETSLKKSARSHFWSFVAIFPSLSPRFWCSATISSFSHRERVHRNSIWSDRNAFALFATLIGPFAPCLSRSHFRSVCRISFCLTRHAGEACATIFDRKPRMFFRHFTRTHQQSDD